MFADALLTGSVIMQFEKLTTGEQLGHHYTHRKL